MPTYNTPTYYNIVLDSTYIDLNNPGPRHSFAVINATSVVGIGQRVTNSNPNWRQEVSRGVDASRPYSRSSYRVWPAVFTCTVGVPGAVPGLIRYISSARFRYFTGESLISFSEDVAVRELALARLKRKLSASIGSADVFVPTVELYELRRSIVAVAEYTTDSLLISESIRKGKVKHAAKLLSDIWLAWSLGIKPLIKDVKDASDAVSAYILRKDINERLSGSAKKTWITGFNDKGSTFAFGAPLGYSCTAHHRLSYRYVGGFNVKLASGNNYGIDEHLGFELSSVPALLWELFPYSWIIDYFTTMGNYFSDTFVLPPGSLKYLVLTRKYEVEIEMHGGPIPNKGVRLYESWYRYGTLKYFKIDRFVLPSLPYQSLRLKSADEIGKKALVRTLNLAALLGSNLAQVIRR